MKWRYSLSPLLSIAMKMRYLVHALVLTLATHTVAAEDPQVPTDPIPIPPVDTLSPDQGAIDGVYLCQADLLGKKLTAYISLNGKGSGQTVFIVGAENASEGDLFGYGIGSVSGKKFTGNTSFGKQFQFDITPVDANSDRTTDAVQLKGTMGVVNARNVAFNVHLDCKGIF
jgi:hypothetical protein